MESYKLVIVGQSADLKLSPTKSKDTGIFLPNDLLDFLGWNTGDSPSFIIYKEDCIKSAVEILSHLPLYSSKSGNSITHDDIMADWSALSSMIDNFFGVEASMLYEGSPFTITETTGERKYLYKLDQEDFNLRHLFVAGKTTAFFSKSEDGDVILRFTTNFSEGNPSIDFREEGPFQKIYYGAPGTGKSHEVKILTGELDEFGNEFEQPSVFRTTFHPDTDYAAFVGCYKPTMKPVPTEYRAVAGKEEDIAYEFVPQAFTDAYTYAYKNPTENTFLVIEEINRGNCAQIFGDLFQLLDRNGEGKSEYTIKADKDLANYLTKKLGVDSDGIKDGKLRLPANLHILATMNTSDQSLFPMDSAFKRRWDWQYVAISYSEPKSKAFQISVGEGYSWVKFIEQVNKRIFALTQSEDKEMGNFFIKDSIDAEQFKSKVMFYLWYEVLRDEVENSKYFFYHTTADESGKETNHKFTFKDLYGENSKTILEGFLKYITKDAE